MAKIDFEYRCPRCNEVASYNPTNLNKGVCRRCGEKFTPEQIETISKGIENTENERKIQQVTSKLKKK